MITAFIVEGDLRNVLFSSRLRKRMRRMKDHVIVVESTREPESDEQALADARGDLEHVVLSEGLLLATALDAGWSAALSASPG